MNWGTKIIIGMVTFMVFIVALVLIMFNSRKDALVENDYYEKGINYNEVYNRKELAHTDHVLPEISVTGKYILLTFKEKANGTLALMRTADKTMDRSIKFDTNINHQLIVPLAKLNPGPWRMIVEWQSNEKSYMYEQEIILP